MNSLRLGDHACAIYETEAELVRLVAAYLQRGLARGEQCICIRDASDDVRQELEALGTDLEAAVEAGQLLFVTKKETYLRDGDFQPDAMLAFLQDATEAATETFAGARGMGEMSWSKDVPDGFDRLIEYERKVNLIIPQIPFVGFCAYQRDKYPPEVLVEVMRAHPTVLYGGRAYQNFFYIPPEEYASGNKPQAELERLLENLEARQRLEEDRIHAAGRAQELVRLREAETIKDQLIGAAAHELRNPLTPLRMQLGILQKGASADQQPTLDVMQRSIDRMADLLGDFMSAVRLRPDVALHDLRDVHVGRLAQDVVEELGPLAQQKSIRISATVEPVRIQIDQRRVLQAIFNLVSNGIKYTPEGGRISLSTRPSRGGALITVEDNGLGWAPGEGAKLFRSFVRLANSQHVPGTGMGLYVAKRIAEQHGGTLTAHSAGKGKGSRFELWLPRKPMAQPTVEPLIQAAP